MVLLSVNVNKVATIRNSRGGTIPSVVEAARVCLEAGAPGITVHPRADERHIRASDVRDLAELMKDFPGREYNIEGDPRPDLMDLVVAVKPTQCTLVPVRPGEVTSEAGWSLDDDPAPLDRTIARLQSEGVRVSLFVDVNTSAVEWAKARGTDRVELYTEPYARAFERGEAPASFDAHVLVAERAHQLGLGLNAGHDLDLENLPLFCQLPHLAEVSIGHALISRALFEGLGTVVGEYLDILRVE